ncbi:MAG TPA: thioredoxin domain-containing protein [Terriglobia bacterium]|nr:thioredoxin domain-containing protein [Terriglobia bacterium]
MRKVLLLVLTLGGLFDALYLRWVYTSPSHPLICLGTGCDVVRASRYAEFWGQPVPVFGVLMYGTLLVLVLAQAWLVPLAARQLVQETVALISGAGVAFSIYLTGLEAFVIHAWCAWCVASAIIVALIFLLAVADVRPQVPGSVQALETEAARFSVRKRYGLILVLMTVAGVFVFRYLVGRPELPPGQDVSDQTLDEHLVQPDSHSLGNPNATVTVVEFGDFECPACGRAEPVVEQLLAKYGTKIRFVFRQFPLSQIHPYAQTAAEASECAAQQGKFWEAERKFYQNQYDLSEPALDRYAAELGLDTRQFDECLINGTAKARVERDLADGHAAGVLGTPTFFVGHEKFFGPPDYQQLAGLIDRQLAKPGDGKGGTTAKSKGPPAGGSAASDGNGSSFGSFGDPAAASAFASPANAALGCSPDELKNRQPTLIHTADVQKLLASDPKPVFIDVRPAAEFAAGHLPGALSIPVDQLDPRATGLPKDKTLVLYESGHGGASDVCAVSRAGARVLLSRGFDFAKILVYQDGLEGWQKAGLAVQK